MDLIFEAKAKDFNFCSRGHLEAKNVLEDSTSGFKFKENLSRVIFKILSRQNDE